MKFPLLARIVQTHHFCAYCGRQLYREGDRGHFVLRQCKCGIQMAPTIVPRGTVFVREERKA